MGPLSDRILLIGAASWQTALRRNWEVITAPSGKRARLYADQYRFSLIIVDAVSMRITGERVCRAVKSQYPYCPLIHIQPSHSANPSKVADVTLSPPLSSRKLIGVVSRMLQEDMTDTLRCGPFLLNRTTRILQTPRQEVQLNPKLAELIALFMAHPNQVLQRQTIMREVWNTDYMGDTRTLNVHIRYARNALEDDKRKPIYLKTVRGVGYRLDVPQVGQSKCGPAAD